MNDLLEAFGITKEDFQEEEKVSKNKKKQSTKKEVKTSDYVLRRTYAQTFQE